LNLVIYMHLRIFVYTSNVLIASFECKELIRSTFQPWRCITVLMPLRRDTYWFSTVFLVRIWYRSQTSDILFCSRIQKIPTVLPTGGRTVIPSGRIRQNLSFVIVSFRMPPLILLSSSNAVVMSFRIVWSHFSPVTQEFPFWSR
jgi:hypothetical protein